MERFAILLHCVLSEALDIEIRHPLSESIFRYFFRQVDEAAFCAAIRYLIIAQIPNVAADLDQPACDGKI